MTLRASYDLRLRETAQTLRNFEYVKIELNVWTSEFGYSFIRGVKNIT